MTDLPYPQRVQNSENSQKSDFMYFRPLFTHFFGFLIEITPLPERKLDIQVSFWPFWALKKVGFFLVLEDLDNFGRKSRYLGVILGVFFLEIFDFWTILDHFQAI